MAAPAARTYNHPPIPDRPWPRDEEIVERLTAMGPGVLEPVIDALRWTTPSGEDQSPFVRVLAAVGDEGDAPILIDTLARLTELGKRRNQPAHEGSVRGRPSCVRSCSTRARSSNGSP